MPPFSCSVDAEPPVAVRQKGGLYADIKRTERDGKKAGRKRVITNGKISDGIRDSGACVQAVNRRHQSEGF